MNIKEAGVDLSSPVKDSDPDNVKIAKTFFIVDAKIKELQNKVAALEKQISDRSKD